MLKEKQGQYWNMHQIPHKASYPDFRFSSYYFFMNEIFEIKLQLLIFSPEETWKRKEKSKIRIRSFVRNSMQIPKLSLFSF